MIFQSSPRIRHREKNKISYCNTLTISTKNILISKNLKYYEYLILEIYVNTKSNNFIANINLLLFNR